jgi:hypothetical protein
MMQTKFCKKCGKEKPISEFWGNHKGKDGLAHQCKECAKKYCRQHYQQSDAARNIKAEYREQHRLELREKARAAYYENKEALLEQKKEYTQRTKGHRHDYNQQYYLRTKDRQIQHKIEARRRDVKKRISHTFSSRMRIALASGKKGRPWENLVGYTVDDLKKHLEKQFSKGMTWGNYGEWHIDHKIPVAVFNFKSFEDIDFKRCFALSNLQPMWALENISKGAKLDKPFQPSLTLRV